MKNLFEQTSVKEMKQRIAQLRPDSERQWGKRNSPTMYKHVDHHLRQIGA